MSRRLPERYPERFVICDLDSATEEYGRAEYGRAPANLLDLWDSGTKDSGSPPTAEGMLPSLRLTCRESTGSNCSYVYRGAPRRGRRPGARMEAVVSLRHLGPTVSAEAGIKDRSRHPHHRPPERMAPSPPTDASLRRPGSCGLLDPGPAPPRLVAACGFLPSGVVQWRLRSGGHAPVPEDAAQPQAVATLSLGCSVVSPAPGLGSAWIERMYATTPGRCCSLERILCLEMQSDVHARFASRLSRARTENLFV